MQCEICRSTFRLTAYNRTTICHMCQAQDVAIGQYGRYDEDVELEVTFIQNQGRTPAVFDSESNTGDDRWDDGDFGHGL